MRITRKNFLASLIALALSVAATASVAAESKGDPVAGKTTSQLCQGCHGEDGNSIEDLIPKLSGQYPDYISKQFRNFQTGEREHQIMSAMAAIISDAELRDIAAYFSSQKAMSGGGKGSNPTGKELFTKGNVARDLPACETCHGANGKGSGPEAGFPVIGGQHKGYLRAQLTHWKSGERHNSQGGMMNQVAKKLTDAEIEALADYASGL